MKIEKLNKKTWTDAVVEPLDDIACPPVITGCGGCSSCCGETGW